MSELISDNFYYSSRDISCRKPFGAIVSGKRIEFNFYAKFGVYVNEVYLVINLDGQEEEYVRLKFKENKDGMSRFSVSRRFDTGLYFYHFSVDTELGRFELYKGRNAVATDESANSYQITVYDKEYKTPDFLKGGVIYHIFADRFNRGKDSGAVFDKKGVLKDWSEPVTVVDSDGVFRANDFYGGNLQGIIDKLPYLKALNVSLIYLSPIFKSASNHRYDTGDYMQIDPLLGNEEKFRELIAKAKKNGIGIMLDGVFNHTGADSKYFNKFSSYDSIGAYQSKESPYYDWYYFTNHPDEYACWWGVTVVPTVNKTNEEYRKFIFGDQGVIEKWLSMGVKGLRLDVVDELDISFVDGIREKTKSVDKDAVIIGEVWEDASNKISYSQRRPYFLGRQLDGVMNYPFKNAIMGYIMNGSNEIFEDEIMNIVENYPKSSLDDSMTFIDTHDTVRALNIFSGINAYDTDKVTRSTMKLSSFERALGSQRMKLAGVLQYALPGVPSIYYGDEAGLDGFEDPINRKPFPWNDIDEDMLAHFILLGNIRKKYSKIFKGNIEFVKGYDILVFDRVSDTGRIRIAVNPFEGRKEISFNRNFESLVSGVTGSVFEINARGFEILREV